MTVFPQPAGQPGVLHRRARVWDVGLRLPGLAGFTTLIPGGLPRLDERIVLGGGASSLPPPECATDPDGRANDEIGGITVDHGCWARQVTIELYQCSTMARVPICERVRSEEKRGILIGGGL